MQIWKVMLITEAECRERKGVFGRVKEVDKQIYGVCKFLIEDDAALQNLPTPPPLDPEALS